MMHRVRNRLSRWLPPALVDCLARRKRVYGYFGDYSCWEDARRASGGYDSGHILEKVCASLLKVKQGVAVYERDSVLFDEVQHAWPLLAGLLWIASREDHRLNLLDFGGSLGSSYYQCRAFLQHLPQLRWSIVEQEAFVRRGRELFEDEVLRFYYSLDECICDRNPDVVLLSSVLPYLESPHRTVSDILSRAPSYVVVDRTPFIEGRGDRLTVQVVPQEIYGGSYPAWMLGEDPFLELFSEAYEVIARFDALGGEIDLGDEVARFKGFLFAKRGSSRG
ncbi:methyltransferase, TIGR04325 family [Geomonas sp. RF6]|uniref:methyltransferase, TIGR04325 family n=1 Tax=Geomonas sp. RF6 TaxID=2897342 RepID=UPI001E5EEB4F|nr:methyltransferase, TIGR04325 family [Geomonas sp. RF6]UFS69727.1 methyltransferase, TIGR04325 family [Geomonas sp. RF6]